jgi:hypothetical protein
MEIIMEIIIVDDLNDEELTDEQKEKLKLWYKEFDTQRQGVIAEKYDGGNDYEHDLERD